MQVGEKKLYDLLFAGNQFVIPVFQRDYVWKERDWERLWEDITALRAADGPAEHFMGSIVSVPMEISPGEIPRYLIIDGQQRLITFAVLLSALRDEAVRFNVETLPEQIQRHYLTHDFQKGLGRYKVLPRLRDRREFFQIVEGNGRPASKSRVLKAYDYFADRLAQEGGDKERALQELFTAVTAKLSLVTITLKPDQNAFAIFATLNATGQKLEEADLIRNFVFMDVSLDEQDEFDTEHWLPFETAFAAGDGLPAVSLTAFYRDFLMREGTYVRRDEVYVAFQKDREVMARSRIELLALLREYAELYLWIERPSTAPTETLRRHLRRFKRVDQSTSYPLVLALLHRYFTQVISEKTLCDCLDVIISFVLRRAVTNWSTRAYNRLFPAAVTELVEGEEVSSLTCYLTRKGWPDDQAFIEALVEYPIYRRWPNLARLILVAVERPEAHKESVDVEGLLDAGTLQIEHVLPQTIGNDSAGRWWKSHLGEQWEEAQRDWLHTIGNLTLTGYNTKLSNRDFAWKKEQFASSNLRVNDWFGDLGHWTADEIRARGETIAAEIAKRWKEAPAYEPRAADIKLDPGEAPARPSQMLAPLRREFWEYAEPTCADAGVALNLTDYSQSHVRVREGLSRGETWAIIRTRKPQLAIQFYSNWPNTGSLFNWLRSNRQEIEDSFPESVHWLNASGSNAQRLEVVRIIDLADCDSWPEYRDWVVSRLQSLKRVLGALVGRRPQRDEVPEPSLAAFLEDLETFNPEVVPAVRRLVDWASREMAESSFTASSGVLTWTPWLKLKGTWYQLIRLLGDGSIEFRFTQLKKPPFDDPHVKEALLERANAIPLVALAPEALESNLRLPLAMMQGEAAFDALLALLNWFVDKAHGDGGSGS